MPVVTLLAERCVVVVVVQVGSVMVLSFNVTVPALSAKNRPSKVAPDCIALTPFSDITVPMNDVVELRVVELPTLHHTLQGSPPVTLAPVDVINVDPVLKIQTPDPVRFRVVVIEKLLSEQ